MKPNGLLVNIVLTISLLCMSAVPGFAGDIRGYFVPEYYAVASHHDGEDGIEGQNGFWFRRIYFGYNTGLGDGWSVRLRLEMASSAFESSTMVPYVKNLHIKKKLNSNLSLLAGVIQPPSFTNVEKFWGYRWVEKTAPDFFKFASSRDIGVALSGKAKGGLVYDIVFGNYSSNKGESNKGKAVYGRLGWQSKSAFVEANGHYASDKGKDITYLSLFGGLKGSWGRFGVGYNHRNEKPEEGDSKNNGIISAFAAVKIGKKMNFFARYDHLTDLNFKDISGYVPVPAKMYKARFLIAGLDFQLHKMVKLSPNVKYVFYDAESGDSPKGDLHLNLTAKISFKTKL